MVASAEPDQAAEPLVQLLLLQNAVLLVLVRKILVPLEIMDPVPLGESVASPAPARAVKAFVTALPVAVLLDLPT